MALVKWEPRRPEIAPFKGLRDEVDRLFEDFFRGWPRPWTMAAGPAPAEGEFVPAVDMKETDGELVLTADLPGLPKEALDVNITPDSVTIKGERKEEKEEKEAGYYRKESSDGSFQRVLALPTDVVPDKASAKLKDGVLTLRLPKSETAKKKSVKVTVK